MSLLLTGYSTFRKTFIFGQEAWERRALLLEDNKNAEVLLSFNMSLKDYASVPTPQRKNNSRQGNHIDSNKERQRLGVAADVTHEI